MPRARDTVEVYLELGAKRVFAGAIDWPGWCRSGKDERAALEAMTEYGPRYAKVLRRSRLGFSPPPDATAFAVRERLKGDATTDFGAPGKAPSVDSHPMDERALSRFRSVLRASWRAFDAAVDAAAGTELRRGPRGGGRDLDQIVRHVIEAEAGYLARVGRKHQRPPVADPALELPAIRREILAALSEAARGKPVRIGP